MFFFDFNIFISSNAIAMKAYHDLLQHILEEGVEKMDRTGTGTKSIFGYQMKINLEEGFPLLTTKKVAFRWLAEELLLRNVSKRMIYQDYILLFTILTLKNLLKQVF